MLDSHCWHNFTLRDPMMERHGLIIGRVSCFVSADQRQGAEVSGDK